MVTVSDRVVAPLRVPRRRRRRNLAGLGFLTPFLIVFAFALVAPVIYAIYLSFFQDRLVGGNVFAGLANYELVLKDDKFWSALGRVLLFFCVQVPIMLGLSTFAALALDSARLKFASFVRISLFLPYAVPSVVAALMWGFIYGTDFGLVGNLNSFFGISIPDPLSSEWVLAAMGNIATWGFVGYNMLILYAALQVVSKDLYEAADLDGASTWQIIRAIKLPAMRGGLTVALVFSVIGAFQLFNEPNVLRTLAPASIVTNFTPNMYAYNLAFAGQQFNYSAAIAIVMGILTMIVALVVQTVGTRRDKR